MSPKKTSGDEPLATLSQSRAWQTESLGFQGLLLLVFGGLLSKSTAQRCDKSHRSHLTVSAKHAILIRFFPYTYYQVSKRFEPYAASSKAQAERPCKPALKGHRTALSPLPPFPFLSHPNGSPYTDNVVLIPRQIDRSA